MGLRGACRDLLFRRIPVARRLALARIFCRLHGGRWAPALVKDLAQADPAGYHYFLWRNHLTPARWFAAGRRLDALAPTRVLLLADVGRVIGPAPAIRSVLDVGCSSGYLLRSLEASWGVGKADLMGFDVDRAALARGRRYLAGVGSRVRLVDGDLRSPPIEGRGEFDLVVCAGVLMYFPELAARVVVARLLGQARQLLVLSAPACQEGDNLGLQGSLTRAHATFVHNLDAMVTAAGGAVVGRRWQGAERLGGQTVYFVLARGVARAGQ